MAAAAFVCAAIFSRRSIGEELKTISPVTLTPLAVILGLIIAFIAARVWENVARANEYVGQEASALSDVVLFSKGLSPEVRTNLLAAVKEHVAFVEEQDWPAMASFSANLQSEPVGLITALTVLLSFRPMERNHELAQQRAVRAIQRAFEARENRIRLSKAQIAPIQWAVIVVLSLLILVTTALIHIGRPAAMAVAEPADATTLSFPKILINIAKCYHVTSLLSYLFERVLAPLCLSAGRGTECLA